MESLFQKTLFKYLTGSIVVTSDGGKPHLSTIAVRSLIRFIPFEPISLLFVRQDEQWWHDIWTKTYVVEEAKMKASLIGGGSLYRGD